MIEDLKNRLRQGRWRLRAWAGRDVYFRPQILLPSIRLGGDATSSYGAWAIAEGYLSPRSVIYSVGIGTDITFDLQLIRHFGAYVHAFDPTPASLRWLAMQALPPNLIVHPYGLAHYDGTATFYPPSNPAWVSHSVLPIYRAKDKTIEVPVRRLSTLMAILEHDRIDLLKLDIEGAEYAVIDDIIYSQIGIHQILIEFHHHCEGIHHEQTAQAVRRLNAVGYRIFHVSPRGEEYSFIRA
jgi:FkbM family methyltransferase